MRSLMIAAACAALLGLTACSAKPEAPAEPAAPKSMARMVQMYQGQEQIAKIDTAAISIGAPGSLTMTAQGSVDMPGFKNAGFLPRINAAPPKDGVYEVDVVADRPTTGTPAPTPIEVKGAWESYPADRLKGVKLFSKTNSVVVMLPAG